MLASTLLTQSRAAASGGRSKEETLLEVAGDILARMPPPFDLELAGFRYPVCYEESMNSVLCQEMVRYNRLTDVIRGSLKSLQKGLKGLVVMSAEMEQLANSMYVGKVPAAWAARSYPSLKPLSSYIEELLERLAMLQSWMDNGPPAKFWISGFYFTHAFLTGVLQNFARKYKIPIDTVGFDFESMPPGEYNTRPEDGAYVTGMFLEGARWDSDKMQLAESLPKVLYSTAPVMWLKPVELSKRREFPHYSCPVYRTAERRGVLATTGHSSNFVMEVKLPTDVAPDHWVRRGVAMLLSLSQ